MGCFIVAEMSANHAGSLEIALETVRAAKRAGADAVKIQTYRADTITLNVRNNDFLISGTLWDGKYLYDLYHEAHLPWEWHEAIFEEARKTGIVCFSTPFDKTAVDLLESLGNPIYKIASLEITDIPLIRYVASKNKPVIISTGVAGYNDIILAVETCRECGNHDITLLKCTTAYPAPVSEANLIMIQQYVKDFNVKAGLSDHTLGTVVPVAAAVLGASVIEKHFILDKKLNTPDAAFSLDEHEFKLMVEAIRQAEQAVGNIDYTLTPAQIKGRKYARSLYVAKDLKKGEIISHEHIKSVRPGYGMHPIFLDTYIGKPSPKDFKKGDRFIV
ncbi:MAG: pseudaminic acid synthase [Bacteroidia bacterium]|nr:pseudaminic acid synthase [Bacteroidia bacterium]